MGSPDQLEFQWIGQQDVLAQLLAAWLVIDKDDIPLNPRLIGKPGVGKTTLAYAAAHQFGKDVYIFASSTIHAKTLLTFHFLTKRGIC